MKALTEMNDAEFGKAVEDKHARLYPTGCPMLCEACGKRLGITNETETERNRRNRTRIARSFGHDPLLQGVPRG